MFVDFLTIFVPLAIVVSLVLAVVATRRIWGDIGFTPDQRAVQIWIIWLLPIVGASLVLAMLHDEPRNTKGGQTRSALRNG